VNHATALPAASSSYGAKYAAAGSLALADSFARPWRGFGAELRRHAAVDAPGFVQPVTEVAIGIAGHGRVSRRADGEAEQRFEAQPGRFCICPGGVPVDHLRLQGEGVELLHFYVDGGLDPDFAARTALADWPYAGGLADPLVAQIGLAMAQELRQESSGDLWENCCSTRWAMRCWRASGSGTRARRRPVPPRRAEACRPRGWRACRPICRPMWNARCRSRTWRAKPA
jgi:hypothetical protein